MNIKQRVSLEQKKEKFKVLEINILQRDAEFWGHDFTFPGELYSAVMSFTRGWIHLFIQ